MSDSGRSIGSKLKKSLTLGSSKSPQAAAPGRVPPKPPPKASPLARDPALSAYINTKALGRPEGQPFQELFRALFDSINGDKTARQQLYGLLLRLFFYEELPPDVITQLVPLLQSSAKETKIVRALYYLLEVYVGAGSAGTPTLYDPGLVGKRPDEKALKLVLDEAWALLQQPDADPALRRATFVLAAAAARGSDSVRKELVSQVQHAIAAADSLADMQATGGKSKGSPARPAALDWDLQHTAFLAVRLGGAATGRDAISRSSFVGVGSADPVGARHALALAADVAYRDAGYVAREMGGLMAAAVKQYDASGPGPIAAPGQGINLEDAWARLYLARACAYVVHSDQSSGDVSRDGAPFWQMLYLLATRDSVDLVRFGAMEALTGAVPSAGGAPLGAGANVGGAAGGKPGKQGLAGVSREDVVFQQRRSRAWRLLVAQAATQVTIPGAQGSAAGPMKLIECLGRLLLAAVRRSGPTRLVAACNVVGSLAESCLASQSVTSRHNTSPDCDRVLAGLAAGLSAALDADAGAAQRCACLEALLYLQAAGYPTGLTPAKMSAAAGGCSAGWAGGLQDSLLATVLKCAKAKPKQAAAFLGYATAAVGISPVGIDLGKVTGLWDAAAAGGREGKEAALAAALGALHSPPPASVQPRGGLGGEADVARAVREEDGWNAFVATAAWWVGEHANSICGEYSGRKLSLVATNGAEEAAGEDGAAALQQQAGRNPLLSRILQTLQSVAMTAVWQVRLAAAHAVAKIAVRSGEPFRLQCYAILAACSGGVSDPLGLQSATAPALAVLDKIYATQAVLDQLWRQYGDDMEGWPDEVVSSLARRNKALTLQAERYVCGVPKERCAVLGHRALRVLATAKEEEGLGLAGTLGFLSQQRSDDVQQEAALSDRTGSELAKSKNREIESILSYSDDGGAFANKFASAARSDVSATIEDKNKEIESVLSGGGAPATDPWAAPSSSFSSFNAFLEGGEAAPSPNFAVQPGGAGDETPKFGASTWFAEEQQQQQQAAATPAAGHGGARTATVMHMFVADYNQPEELSVFEGDKVEILEESDGWMLVKDPSGSQGLVPTSYLRLDAPPPGARRNSSSSHKREPTAYDLYDNGASGGGAAEEARQAARGRGHGRSGSLDYSTSKEDYLDNIFSAAPFAEPALPTTPEDFPLAAASEDTRLFGGGNSAADEEPAMRTDSGGGARRRSGDVWGSPPHTGDSWGGGRSDSVIAAQPLRAGDDWARSSSADYGGGGGGSLSPSAAGLARPSQSGEVGAIGRQGSGNPFTPTHRRTMSGASSSHRRSASGGSGDFSPRETGQERSIVAGFDAEMDGELSVAPGERVKVHSDVAGWVRVVRLLDHKSGLVPSWAVGLDS